jgi:type II secretory pathway pseudopilin PulG
MVFLILTISVVSIASVIVAASVFEDSFRTAREETEKGAGRYRYFAMSHGDAEGHTPRWQHANNNRPVRT